MASLSSNYSCRSSPRHKIIKSLKLNDDQDGMNAANNNVSEASLKLQAQSFANWYKNLIDNDRNNFCLYIAENAVLQWFGRTIKSKKKVTGFIKYDMNQSNHVLISVKPCGPITLQGVRDEPTCSRQPTRLRDSPEELAVPMDDAPFHIIKNLNRVVLRSPSSKRVRSISSSPEDSSKRYHKKKPKQTYDDLHAEISNLGEKKTKLLGALNNKYNLRSLKIDINRCMETEVIQNFHGESEIIIDSGDKVNQDFELTLLPKKFIEATCILQFIKTRNKRGAELHKWERQCQLQIAYTVDPVCAGDYIIWTILYNDNNKCRRNLMAAFDAADV